MCIYRSQGFLHFSPGLPLHLFITIFFLDNVALQNVVLLAFYDSVIVHLSLLKIHENKRSVDLDALLDYSSGLGN